MGEVLLVFILQKRRVSGDWWRAVPRIYGWAVGCAECPEITDVGYEWAGALWKPLNDSRAQPPRAASSAGLEEPWS